MHKEKMGDFFQANMKSVTECLARGRSCWALKSDDSVQLLSYSRNVSYVL